MLKRHLDKEIYYVTMRWKGEAELVQRGLHHFEIDPSEQSDTFEYSILFSASEEHALDLFTATAQNSESHWKDFWASGAAIDFSESTDPRAEELERRVVLSQYLTKIQCSGSLPPQETGLTFNSWYGKFHLEMHWWHAVHFALWGRPEYLENPCNGILTSWKMRKKQHSCKDMKASAVLRRLENSWSGNSPTRSIFQNYSTGQIQQKKRFTSIRNWCLNRQILWPPMRSLMRQMVFIICVRH